MTASRLKTKWQLGLQAKAVILFLLIATVPIAVSAWLLDEITVVAQNVAEGEAARMEAPLVRAQTAYREAIAARKEVFRQASLVVAANPELEASCIAEPPSAAAPRVLKRLLAADDSLASISLRRDGAVLGEAGRGASRDGNKTLSLTQPLSRAPDCVVAMLYMTPDTLLNDFQELGRVLQERRDRGHIRSTLPASYEITFLVIVALSMLFAAVIAIFVARRTIRRIGSLIGATKRVGEGDLEVRASLPGGDELAQLGNAFDQMVIDLKRSRAEIEYLQKIGAWQEVARRLAHEIKNPLTPIQLSMQELHSKYAGDNSDFQRLLDDSHSIVSEEIAALRRLVDAFSGFSKLPRVEAQELDLAVVMEDVEREHEVELVSPSQPVIVSGDRFLLRRAFLNLVENAHHAGAKRVRLSWMTGHDEARLVVEDDGPGVADDLRDRIFDPYVTGSEQGTGLGLAIVKKTMLEHHGDVEVRVGRSKLGGAEFVVTLPLAE